MATGETITGKVRLIREDTEGNRSVVAGPYSTSVTDYDNQNFGPSEFLYVNTPLSNRMDAPLDSRETVAGDAVFKSGEKYIVQHKSNADNSRSIDYDYDGFALDIMKKDLNRGTISPDELTVADQELSNNPSESASGFVTIFRETVPDRREYRHVGRFGVTPAEV
jgi:hypothetical protein